MMTELYSISKELRSIRHLLEQALKSLEVTRRPKSPDKRIIGSKDENWYHLAELFENNVNDLINRGMSHYKASIEAMKIVRSRMIRFGFADPPSKEPQVPTRARPTILQVSRDTDDANMVRIDHFTGNLLLSNEEAHQLSMILKAEIALGRIKVKGVQN